MALRGTLRDFGIADILQLIGHQNKSGVLTVKNSDRQVDIYFSDGDVVRAESATRDNRDLLGRMLVRAQVLSEEQIGRALEVQKRTLKRLGQVLVESGSLDRRVLTTFTRLQTTETIYRLFFWSSGTYEFTQKAVQADSEFGPIKSESILMEGFRQLDEWPSIRRKVTSYGLVFDRVKDLDVLVAAPATGDDLAFDELDFGGDGGGSDGAALRNIGQHERLVYQLVTPERDVQKLIDLSRLGEFETCKALDRLIEGGFIQALPQERAPSADATVGGISARARTRFLPVLTRVALTLVLVASGVLGLRALDAPLTRLVGADSEWGYADLSLKAEVSAGQMQKIGRALEVYASTTGAYPASLEELVAARLLTERDLRFPWANPYAYRREQAGYVLLRPLN